MMALLKWGCVGIYSLGIAFCLFSLSMRRLSLILVIGGTVFAAAHWNPLKSRLLKLVGWLKQHPGMVLSVIIIASVAVRVGFALLLPENGLRRMMGSDARNFWRYAQEMANGTFPDVKSWITTAYFAAIIRFFNHPHETAVCINTVLQACTAVALYLFAKRIGTAYSGTLSASAYILAPSIVFLNFAMLTETHYFLLLALTFLALLYWIHERRRLALLSLPLLTWLTIWTRGEAFLLLILLPACLFADIFLSAPRFRLRRILVFAFLGLALTGFAALSFCINIRFHGTQTIFCSNDNWWPRLYGSNVASQGRVSGPKTGPKRMKLVNDKTLMFARYRQDHANDPNGGTLERKPMFCPKELVPYIREEISRRWAALSTLEKIQFVLVKERLPWRNPYVGKGQFPEKKLLKALYYDAIPTLTLVLCLIGLFHRLKQVIRNDYAPSGTDVVQLVPILYLFGIVSMIAIAESNIRYGVIALLICPLYAFSPMPSQKSHCTDSR